MSKFNTAKMGRNKEPRARIKIRILRSWHGYGPGAVISPPAGARQIMLDATDQLGRQIAEIVTDEPSIEPVAAIDEDQPEGEAETTDGVVKRGPGRPRKAP